MAQQNTNRISHDVDAEQNVFRDDQLERIINDLGEEDTGKGFSETSYVGSTPFIDQITTYDSAAKNYVRSIVDFTYSPLPFIGQIVKTVYNKDGTNAVATITAVVTYNTNKTIKDVNVVTART